MRIADLLAKKGSDVVTVHPDTLVSQVVGELTRHNIGAVVVSTNRSMIEGIASERDIVRAFNQFGAVIFDQSVRSIMSSSVRTCSPEDTLESLMETMTNHRIRHVPVVDHGSLIGIVSIGDVVKVRMLELENDRNALVDYIEAR